MLSPEERALLTKVQDRLLELYVRKDEAMAAGDCAEVRALQREIVDAEAERDDIRSWDAAR